jgi:hypothetical protein
VKPVSGGLSQLRFLNRFHGPKLAMSDALQGLTGSGNLCVRANFKCALCRQWSTRRPEDRVSIKESCPTVELLLRRGVVVTQAH